MNTKVKQAAMLRKMSLSVNNGYEDKLDPEQFQRLKVDWAPMAPNRKFTLPANHVGFLLRVPKEQDEVAVSLNSIITLINDGLIRIRMLHIKRGEMIGANSITLLISGHSEGFERILNLCLQVAEMLKTASKRKYAIRETNGYYSVVPEAAAQWT
jgi:hypothetical protein